MLERLEVVLSQSASRREFLRLTAASAAALSIASQLSSPILAHHAIADLAWWGTYDWWPLQSGIRNEGGILMHTLHETGGPLHQHDVDTGRHAREWAEDLARRVLNEYPGTEEWQGYCHAKANAIFLEEPPIDWIGEGLLVAKHAADILIPIPKERIIPRIQRGNKVVVEVPRHWFSLAYRVESGLIVRTAFGFPHKHHSLADIVTSYVPYYDDGTHTVNEELKAKTAWLINPELDEEYVNWRAFNT